MDSNNNKQEGGNDKDRAMSKKDGSDDDDGNNGYYTVTNPSLIRSISENHSLLRSMITEPILNSLKERYNRRKQVLKHLFVEYIKNEEGTCNFYEAPGNLHTFHDKNNNNDNDEFRSNTKLVGFINVLKAYVTHIPAVTGTLISFEVHLMQSIEVLEKNLKNLEEEATQERMREKRNCSETKKRYYPMSKSIGIYAQRKRAIEIVIFEVKEITDTVYEYINRYQELCGFDDDNKKDEYRDDNMLEEFIDDLKDLNDHVTSVLSQVHSLEGKLMELIEILETNLVNSEARRGSTRVEQGEEK